VAASRGKNVNYVDPTIDLV